MADANFNPNATLQTQGLNVPSAPSTIAQNGFIGNNGFNSTGGLSLASNDTNQQTQTMYAPTGQDNTTIPPVQPTSLNSSNMGITSPIVLPTAPTVSTDGTSNNTSIPSPIPSAESIINTGATQTGTEAKQQAILDKIASLTGSNSSKTTLENTAENSAGVPALTSTLNDLNTQLEGLNNQATALQNEANYTIPNQTQNDAQGRGITTAGLAPITASQLRANQIKQGAIATQALTLKSAIYGAQGKYNIAKDAADKAADAQYDTQQQAIDAQKAQLDALTPTLNKEEKAQAAIVQAQLQDRQNKIDSAKEDKKTIIALATTALTNNPNDPAAHYAAQQALAESNKEQPNLQTALGFVGKYQTDPLATQKAIADIALTKAQTQKALTPALGATGISVALQNAINGGLIDPNKINSRTLGIYESIAQAGVDAVGAHAVASGETKAVTDLASYKSTATRTLGIIDLNLPLVANLADKVNTLGVPGIDDYIRGIKSYTGNNPDVIKYVNSIKTLRSEYAQMLAKGATATEGDKSDAEQAIPSGLSSAGYQALGEQLKLEATNIIQASNDAIAAAKDKSASNTGGQTGGSSYQGITLPF